MWHSQFPKAHVLQFVIKPLTLSYASSIKSYRQELSFHAFVTMSHDKGSDDLNDNNGETNVDNEEEDDISLEQVDIKPDVSMFGGCTEMADAVLVVQGIRIPVVKVQSFIYLYFV